MAVKKNRLATPFSLSFLDIMFCGFGAVVLLVMILNGQVLRQRQAKSEDLRGELARATALEQLAAGYLQEMQDKVGAAELKEGELESRMRTVEQKIAGAETARQAAERKAQEQKEAAARIAAEKEALQRVTEAMRAKQAEQRQSGDKLAGFSGDGQRQYLTGLKLGGKRTVILLDTSASMLDETVVNIIRRRLLPAQMRRQSPKWQRAVRTLHWLIANLARDSHFQVFGFSTAAEPVVQGSGGKWLSAGKINDLNAALSGARLVAPEGGTSLHNAFAAAAKMTPQPDSIILVTDGLPTQGRKADRTSPVTSDERVELFEDALKELPAGVPVNTLLFPMEGDPAAAVSFWGLAITSKGSFITPSRDWP